MSLIDLLKEYIDSSKKNIMLTEKILSLLTKDADESSHVHIQKEENKEVIHTNKKIEEHTRHDNLSQFDEIDEVDEIMQRRIELHKKQGTYIYPTEEKKIHKPHYDNAPKITPFSMLNLDEQNEVAYKIFKDAQFNVKNLMDIDEKSDQFLTAVEKEADRLLEVWMLANR